MDQSQYLDKTAENAVNVLAERLEEAIRPAVESTVKDALSDLDEVQDVLKSIRDRFSEDCKELQQPLNKILDLPRKIRLDLEECFNLQIKVTLEQIAQMQGKVAELPEIVERTAKDLELRLIQELGAGETKYSEAVRKEIGGLAQQLERKISHVEREIIDSVQKNFKRVPDSSEFASKMAESLDKLEELRRSLHAGLAEKFQRHQEEIQGTFQELGLSLETANSKASRAVMTLQKGVSSLGDLVAQADERAKRLEDRVERLSRASLATVILMAASALAIAGGLIFWTIAR
jgi:uncharacterized phage infection (PIP) family protein YhgE